MLRTVRIKLIQLRKLAELGTRQHYRDYVKILQVKNG